MLETDGSQACLATANGTSALLVTLNTMGVGAGDEVIVPPYTFVATINAIPQVAAISVFVDSGRSTFGCSICQARRGT